MKCKVIQTVDLSGSNLLPDNIPHGWLMLWLTQCLDNQYNTCNNDPQYHKQNEIYDVKLITHNFMKIALLTLSVNPEYF